MDKICITPSSLSGKISPPPSKSLSHRAILCAAMAKGISVIDNIVLSKDISVTIGAVRALGASVDIDGTRLTVDGTNMFNISDTEIDCHESGSTLRFLVPVSLVGDRKTRFTGVPYLWNRPLDPFYPMFEQDNISYKKNPSERLDFVVSGSLKGGEYHIDGNVSSQFITGLLYALPLINTDSKIIIENGLQSKGYVDLTLDTLNTFGISIENNNYKEFFIKGNQEYTPTNYFVESDYSQAAFFLCAAAIGNDVVVENVNIDSLQGDKQILNCLEKLGCSVEVNKTSIRVVSSNLVGADIDGSEIPDIVPILSIVCALAKGTSTIRNIERLRIKECDRLNVMATLLGKLGVDVEEKSDQLIIRGTDSFTGGELNSYNDHRIAMSMAIASTRGTQPFVIDDPDCVNKSYIHFWDDFRSLGAITDE